VIYTIRVLYFTIAFEETIFETLAKMLFFNFKISTKLLLTKLSCQVTLYKDIVNTTAVGETKVYSTEFLTYSPGMLVQILRAISDPSIE